MSLELDHVFSFCEPQLTESGILESAGFTVAAGRTHPGQGTANRCVIFQTHYLELIYLAAESEALTNVMQLHLRAQWKKTGKSPFGIALRGELSPKDRAQFWEYHPPYNPSSTILMHHFNELHPEFPVLFVMPTQPTTTAIRFREFSQHGTQSTQMNQVTIQSTFSDWPLSQEVKGLRIEKGAQHRMHIQVDGSLPEELQVNELLTVTSE